METNKPKVDTLTPLGRKVLNEVKAKEASLDIGSVALRHPLLEMQSLPDNSFLRKAG